MFLRRIDQALPVALVGEEAGRKLAEQTRKFAGEIHAGEKLRHAAVAYEGGDAAGRDESLLREVEYASRHLLACEEAGLAELPAHPVAELRELV